MMPDIYSQLIRERISQQGYISLLYKDYYNFQAPGQTANAAANRFNLNIPSDDYHLSYSNKDQQVFFLKLYLWGSSFIFVEFPERERGRASHVSMAGVGCVGRAGRGLRFGLRGRVVSCSVARPGCSVCNSGPWGLCITLHVGFADNPPPIGREASSPWGSVCPVRRWRCAP